MNILNSFSLAGKTALVTGAKRGIGRGMAEALASAGADIIGVSATLDESGSEVGKAVEAMGRSFRGYACDFADRAALMALIARLDADYVWIPIGQTQYGTTTPPGLVTLSMPCA